MLTVALLVQPMLVALVAQKYFQRTGILWAIVALGLSLLLAAFLDNAITSQPEWILDPEHRRRVNSVGHEIAFVLMSVGLSTAVTLIVLATLPKREVGSTSKESTHTASKPLGTASELERLVSLRDREILTQSEFEQQKSKLLNS